MLKPQIQRKPEKKLIKSLIQDIDKDNICLPDFQRMFVWEPKQCAELIESVIRGYPIGTLMLLSTSNNKRNKIKPRSFKGPNGQKKNLNPDYFVIDGQQRLKTFFEFLKVPKNLNEINTLEFPDDGHYKLYLVFKPRIISRFSKNTDDKNDDDKKIKKSLINPEKVDDHIPDIKEQWDDLKIPLEIAVNKNLTDKWFAKVLKEISKKRIPPKRKLNEYKTFITDIRKRIMKYKCNIEYVESKLDPSDYYKIFTLLNEAGTDLELFDEMVAKVKDISEEIDLRDLWKKCKDKYPIIDEFDIDPTYILKVAYLIRKTLEGEKNKEVNVRYTCSEKDLKNKFKHLYNDYGDKEKGKKFENDWGAACKYLSKALKHMRDHFAIINKKYLPYAPMVVTMAASLWWFEYNYDSNTFGTEMRKKIKKWYWGSILEREYRASSDTRIANHYLALRNWLAPHTHRTPQKINFGHFNKTRLMEIFDEIASTADARYKAIICFPLIDKNLEDIYQGDLLNTSKLHDHHIFPKKSESIKKLGNKVKDRDINNLANRMLITEETNRKIKREDPYKYIVEAKIPKSRLDKFFITKSKIPKLNEMSYNKFIEFLQNRKERICEKIAEYLQK